MCTGTYQAVMWIVHRCVDDKVVMWPIVVANQVTHSLKIFRSLKLVRVLEAQARASKHVSLGLSVQRLRVPSTRNLESWEFWAKKQQQASSRRDSREVATFFQHAVTVTQRQGCTV